MYSVGLDIGTTSVCGILVDINSGEIKKSITLDNDTFIKTENEFEKIQDAVKLIGIATSIYDNLTHDTTPVSIGITGQMHGIVYLNNKGEVLSPLKIWQDGRGDIPYKNGLSYAEYMSQITGYPLATGYGAVTYFYDSVNSLVPENTAKFCTIHDLLAMTLAGRKTPLVHSSDAASFGLFDLNKNAFDTVAIEKLGLNPSFFPDVCGSFEKVGLKGNIPVSAAIGDNQASFLGSVANPKDAILINVGTGSQISLSADSVPNNKNIDCRPLLSGSYILAGSSLCGGRAYALLEKFFREVAQIVTGSEVKSAYPAMDKIMENYNSNKSLNVSTLFSGTRSNPEKRGSISGISTENLNMASLCDGFMWGMAEELFAMFSEMKPYINQNKTLLIGSGNGIRFNAPLRKRFEQLFGIKMVIPAGKEEAAFGSVLYSLVAAGIKPNFEDAAKLIKYVED
jgi:sedoheptulokinase